MSLSGLLDKTATHQRSAATKDASGGNVQAWTTLASNVPVAVWTASARTVSEYARRDIVVTHQIATDRDLGATAADRLVIGGVHYLVRGIGQFDNAGISAEMVYVLDCERRIV